MTKPPPSFSRKDHTLTWIAVGDLTVAWPEAQRALSERKAKNIAESFSPDLFGTLTVSPVANGKYHVDDGWTRASAVRMLYGDNERVPCVIVPAGTAAAAARVFYEMNGQRSKPTAMERFITGVTGNYNDECAVKEIVDCQGLSVELAQRDGAISAVGSLLSIYRQYGEDGLRDVLMFIKDTWGKDSAGFNGYLLRGVALFLAQPEVTKTDKLAKKVSRKFTPGRLLGAAKASREAFGGSMPRAVAAIIQEAYAPGKIMSLRTGGGGAADSPTLPLAASPAD
jgi:hypothetical protein